MISMLIIQSVWDFRFKQIPIVVTILGAIGGLCVSVATERALGDIGMALMPGALSLFISWATREAIGYGDGFLLCAMGTYLNVEVVIGILMLASLLAGGIGLFLLVVGKKRRKDELPFVPFLLCASVIYLCSGGL